MADSTPPYAAMALGITVQEWNVLGFGQDPAVAATPDLDATVDRVTALLLVRIVAIVDPSSYADLSTSTICRTALMMGEPWPAAITDQVVSELRLYVHTILSGYLDVPYHNFEHAYHVVISTNKLVDMMLQNTSAMRPTYGLKKDALMQFAMVFAALIHDVEHTGVPNRQLSMEDDDLAILYNDVSIAEQRSLHIGFKELLKPEYKALKQVICPTKEDWRRFRKAVLDLVLNTDIASPERTQIAKSKWKEAFGDPFETVERKVRAIRRGSTKPPTIVMQRRGSGYSIRSEVTSTPEIPEVNGDEHSLSGTPESSEFGEDDQNDPLDGVVISGVTMSSNSSPNKDNGTAPKKVEPVVQQKKLQDRLSMASGSTHRTRLSIRRSMDLSGETLEFYSSHTRGNNATENDLDEPDELKASVVMETIMTAADVGHNLQSFDHMVKWSGRLYLELRRAYVQGRGVDVQPRWFENQIGFLESYLMPMARRLEDMGVFDDSTGQMFANIVDSSLHRWMEEGEQITATTIAEGNEKYPLKSD